MKVRGGNPRIVKKGLVFYVDAQNPYSEPGTGYDWNDITNNGMNLSYYNTSGGVIVRNTENGIKSYHRSVVGTVTDNFAGSKNILLDGDFTFSVWVKAITSAGTSANGILTNHYHGTNSGSGITLAQRDTDDYRISMNTGTGTARTYNSHYGTTNVKGLWVLAMVRFIKSTNNLSIWVNAVNEKEITYAQHNTALPIHLFQWSCNHNTTAYKPEIKISQASAYNIALTDSQILQNYNATKTRYGL